MSDEDALADRSDALGIEIEQQRAALRAGKQSQAKRTRRMLVALGIWAAIFISNTVWSHQEGPRVSTLHAAVMWGEVLLLLGCLIVAWRWARTSR
jgi:hypothetical protein